MQNHAAAAPQRAATPASGERLAHALGRLELALIRHRSGVRRRLAVSDEELAVLLYLGHEGHASQARLAALSTLSRSGIGALLQRLESEGLVERRTQPGDRRVRLVQLSDRGRAGLGAAYRERDAALERLPGFPGGGAERLLGELARAVVPAVDAEPEVYAGDASPIWGCWG